MSEETYFVYELLRPDGTTFYVGMSRDLDRPIEHTYYARKKYGKSTQEDILQIIEDGNEVQWRIVHQTDDLEEARSIEKLFINANKSSVVNIQYGREDIRERFLKPVWNKMGNTKRGKPGHSQTEETRAKISTGLMQSPLNEERKRKIGDAHRGRPLSIKHRQAIREGKLGKSFSAEHKKNLSISHQKPWSDARRAAYEAKKISTQEEEIA